VDEYESRSELPPVCCPEVGQAPKRLSADSRELRGNARIFSERGRRDAATANADVRFFGFCLSPFAVSAFIRAIRENPR
jgi:hypothetical protein